MKFGNKYDRAIEQMAANERMPKGRVLSRTVNAMRWDIRPLVGLGPLKFGMTRGEVAKLNSPINMTKRMLAAVRAAMATRLTRLTA